MIKIGVNQIFVYVWIVLVIGVVLFLGKLVVDNIQLSMSINDSMNVLSPQLNKAKLNQALEAIGRVDVVDINEEIDRDVEEPLIIEIINASGVSGAARDVSDVFPENAVFDLKNGNPGDFRVDVDDVVIILYKAEVETQIAGWVQALEALDWTVGVDEIRDDSDDFDVTVVLQQ